MKEFIFSNEQESIQPFKIKVLSANHSGPDSPIYHKGQETTWPSYVYEYLEQYKPDIIALDSSSPNIAATERSHIPIESGNSVEIVSADPTFTLKHTTTSERLFNPNSESDIIKDISLGTAGIIKESEGAINVVDSALGGIFLLSLMSVFSDQEDNTQGKMNRRQFLKSLALGLSASTLAFWKLPFTAKNPEHRTNIISKTVNPLLNNKLLRLRNIKVWLSTYDYTKYTEEKNNELTRAAIVFGTTHAFDQDTNINSDDLDLETYAEKIKGEIKTYVDAFISTYKTYVQENPQFDTNDFENEVYVYLLTNFSMYTVSQLNKDNSFSIDSLNGQGRRVIPSIQTYIHEKMFPNAVGENIPTLEKTSSNI